MHNWLVIQTRSRWEKKVYRLLLEKGIETFCPLLKVKHQWSDRQKVIEQPLLKSYLFVKIAEGQRTCVRLTEGVLNFVYRNGKPVTVKEKVIQSIKQVQLIHQDIKVVEVDFETNKIYKKSTFNAKGKGVTLLVEDLNLILIAGFNSQPFVKASTDKI